MSGYSFTDAFVKYRIYEVTADDFTSVGQSFEIGKNPEFRDYDRILDVSVIKRTAFDGSAAISLGSATSGAGIYNMATGAEVAADALGVTKPLQWMADVDGYSRYLVNNPETRLFARLSGGLPTVGVIQLIISYIPLSPRPVP